MAGRRGGVTVPISTEFNNRGIEQANKQLNAFGKKVTRSFAGIGAAIGGAFALSSVSSQLQQMAAAAAEDEKSVVSLGKALSNVGLGTAADEAEAFVEQMMLATGVADTDLRNSLQTLATATGDFEQSQRLVQVAMDASAATGRDLASVSLAIAKASQGNVGALTRMGIPLDANIVKAKDFNAALQVMEERFSGQAAAAAETYAGKMQRVSMAVGEAQETIGYELLASLDAISEALGGTDGAVSGIMELGDESAAAIRPLRELADILNQIGGGADIAGAGFDALVRTLGGPVTSAWMRWGRELQEGDEQQGMFAEHLGDIQQNLMDAAVDAGYLGRDYQLLSDDTEQVARSTQRATTALERLQGQMDKMRANRSIAGQRIGLAEMRTEGPGKGENVRKFGLQYADQASSLALDIAERGNFSRESKAQARRVLANARQYLDGLGLGSNFTDSDGAFLGTPTALRPRNAGGARAQRGEAMAAGSVVNNYYLSGDWRFSSPADAVETAKQATRLKALNPGAAAALGN